MQNRYSDFIQRILLHERTLDEPLPTEPTDYELVIRIRETDDATILGGADPIPGASLPLLRAGLFYYHNALADSHQEAAKGDGDLASYWHGMVHRREGDFDNARYWMRRAGEQPVFPEMHGRVHDGAPNMARQSNWDPFLFTMLCEQYKHGEHEYKREIGVLQRVEFAVMFDYVWRKSVAQPSAGKK